MGASKSKVVIESSKNNKEVIINQSNNSNKNSNKKSVFKNNFELKNPKKDIEIDNKLKDKIFFVIPAYNEEKVISKVLDNLLENGFNKIVVVNDGSTDNTLKILERYEKIGVIVLEHVINRGQGAALATGIEYAVAQRDCKYVVTFDSDGQHQLSDLPKFINILEKNKEVDVVLGSRFLSQETKKLVPIKKRVLLKGALVVTFFLSRIRLTDTHNGYRVFRREAARKIDITFDGFEHASEIIDKIALYGLSYVEVPVFINYTEYSKVKGQKITNSIKILLKMLFR